MDVLCVGYACLDLNFLVAHHPGPDEKIRAHGMLSCGGGPAANAAVAVARLGGRAAFIGYLGNDALGEAHLQELITEGVDTSAVCRGAAATPLACVSIKPDGARSIVDYHGSDAICPEDGFDLPTMLPKVLLVDGHQPLLSLRLVTQARALGIPTVLDAGSVHDGTRLLYNQVDYLVASEKFACGMSQELDPERALAMLDGAAPFVAATWGARGVYWLDENGPRHLPAYDIEPVDTTGAGDAFHGAFALGLAEGLSTRANLRRAAATGALTCLRAGARAALPNRAQVERLLQTAPGKAAED